MKIELYVPLPEELGFRQEMMADPDTMSYNAGWEVSFPGYHRESGCIDFPPGEWAAWYADWIGQEPERFYAYIRREDGAFVGEVNFHHTPQKDRWDMGIMIHAPYRAQGYAVPALRLMAAHAFEDCGVNRLYNDFELARNERSAWQTHFSAGFRETGRENGWLTVLLTREDWQAQQAR